jgi:hypothetical protein
MAVIKSVAVAFAHSHLAAMIHSPIEITDPKRIRLLEKKSC